MEYSKLNRQDSTTAWATGHASANAMEQYAQATEELVAEIKEKHTKQIEALIKANNEAMQKLTVALLENKMPSATATVPVATNRTPTATQAERAARWKEKCHTIITCPHCNKIHPNRTHTQCWELEANASKHPVNWKMSKTT